MIKFTVSGEANADSKCPRYQLPRVASLFFQTEIYDLV